MLADQSIVKEEKERMLAEMEARDTELRAEAENAAMLAAQIKAMESKLLVGGKSIDVHTAEQERRLKAHKKKIEEHEKEQR
jgi:kinesin family protein 3/17